ncbi:hypothetical protein [Falsiroseomonas sp.]|uniref:hypothetical protein n=1 Tax=Falsiroseomonas sp. TaxID=2870721 RepID=UPI003F71CAD4
MDTALSRWEQLLLISECAQRYHSVRRSFLNRAAKLEPVLSLVFGSVAFASIFAEYKWITALSALIITAYSAANLSFSFSSCALKHDEMFRNWGRFREDLQSIDKSDNDAVSKLEQRTEELHRESPDQLTLLSAVIEDEVRLARGDEPLLDVPPYKKFLAQFFSLSWQSYRRSG